MKSPTTTYIPSTGQKAECIPVRIIPIKLDSGEIIGNYSTVRYVHIYNLIENIFV